MYVWEEERRRCVCVCVDVCVPVLVWVWVCVCVCECVCGLCLAATRGVCSSVPEVRKDKLIALSCSRVGSRAAMCLLLWL